MESWNRRRFMATAAVASVAAAIAPSHIPGLERIRPAWLSFADLLPLQGERVRMVGRDGTVLNARVVDVADLTRTDDGVTVQQYSVLLRTGLTEPVDEYTFRIEHPRWGHCELFCSPVLSQARGIHYEATLCRLAA